MSSLEKKYGETFVRYSLAYLTLGHSGISEAELEDVLSVSDEVLIEVSPRRCQFCSWLCRQVAKALPGEFIIIVILILWVLNDNMGYSCLLVFGV